MGESRAVRRLRLVLDRAAATGDHDAWLVAAEALQSALSQQDPDGQDRATLRAGMRDACDALRVVPRSRVGRQWGAVTADRVTGPLLRDVLDDPVVDPAEVLALAETGRSRVLLDVLSGHFLGGAAAATRESTSAASVLTFTPDAADSDFEREMRLLSAVRPVSMDEDDLARRSDAVAAVEALYGEPSAGFEGSADVVTLARLQERLAPEEVLVEYIVPYHHLHPAYSIAVLVVTTDDAAVVPVPLPGAKPGEPGEGFIGSIAVDGRAPIDASPLGDLVISARLAVQGDDQDQAWAWARHLHAVLVEPVLATGLVASRTRWVIVPHRQLHPVPWMALADGRGTPWLAERTVTVCPSASVWHLLAGRPRPSRAALALGDPPLAWAGMPPLDGAQAEVEHLGAGWERAGRAVDVRTGADATARALLTASPEAGLVHLATHGSAPTLDAGVDQSILLGLAAGTPGAVDVETLRGVDLGSAWLLSLSICDGGLFFVGQGDEVLGLVGAALEAGATSVIAAQWAVDDASGRRLMSGVIDALVESLDPAEALRRSALAQADAGVPMRDWAPFVLTGSGRGPG